MTTLHLRKSIDRSPSRRGYLLIAVALACFGFSHTVRAVTPEPDGGYANFTTAEGDRALNSLTTGLANTAVGWFSLSMVSSGSYNTGVGAGALDLNTGNENTATGVGALLLNTTGSDNTANGAFTLVNNNTGGNNTAIGDRALENNLTGSFNTATGSAALFSNTTGAHNTATGLGALVSNTTGIDNTAVGDSALNDNNADDNTAVGDGALYSNTTGTDNTAVGGGALVHNTGGDDNTAVGVDALSNNAGGSPSASGNTAIGFQALLNNTSGAANTALGFQAGTAYTTEIGNICIGSGIVGLPGENNTTHIANIHDKVASDRAVYVNGDNVVGTLMSSRRYKEQITPMDKVSEAILRLKPVTFRYKKEVDRTRCPGFGLIAEEVAEINADLVTCDAEGKPETVRYEAVNAMLLNEFLKARRQIDAQQKQIEALTAGLQKVSAQLELSKSAPQTVLNPSPVKSPMNMRALIAFVLCAVACSMGYGNPARLLPDEQRRPSLTLRR